MDLSTLWFILVGVLFTGFFFLEGFDYGVGILMPFLGKMDEERRIILNTIGPVWDANEVWLITAGAAMFAAFPNWYATLFSGFYLALFLMLVALIVRAVAIEFRSKDKNPRWRTLWDWCIFFGSFVPALLWGVAMANIIRGVPIDANMEYVGGFFNLLNPYALLGGLAGLALFTLHGATFLSLRTEGELRQRVEALAKRLWPLALFLGVATAAASYFARIIVGSAPDHLRDRCLHRVVGRGLVVAAETLRMGVRDDRAHHRVDRRDHLQRPLPASDGFQPGPGLEPDGDERIFDAIYLEGDEHRGADLSAPCADLPGVELLGVPRGVSGKSALKY